MCVYGYFLVLFPLTSVTLKMSTSIIQTLVSKYHSSRKEPSLLGENWLIQGKERIG